MWSCGRFRGLKFPARSPATPHSAELRISPADGLMPERAFRGVVIDRQTTIRGVAAQGGPLIAGIGHGFAQRALGKRLPRQLREVMLDPIQHGVGFLTTQGAARCGRQRLRTVLDVIQLSNPLQDLTRFAGVVLARVEELPSRVGPTRHFDNLSARAQEDGVVARIGIGLEEAAKVFQEALRSVSLTTQREVVDRIRMLVISHIGPEATLPAAFFAAHQDRDRRVVGPQDGRLERPLTLQFVERPK